MPDASVAIDHDFVDAALLSNESAIATITVADEVGRSVVRCRCRPVERPDICGGKVSRTVTLSPVADLLIASTAAANGLLLDRRSPSDVAALEGILTVIVAVPCQRPRGSVSFAQAAVVCKANPSDALSFSEAASRVSARTVE